MSLIRTSSSTSLRPGLQRSNLSPRHDIDTFGLLSSPLCIFIHVHTYLPHTLMIEGRLRLFGPA